MERIKNIEILRFIFCIVLVLHHLFNNASYLLKIYPENAIYDFLGKNVGFAGQSVVDLFFIISGFFLYVNIDKTLSVVQFLWKKFIRLAPAIIFLYLCYNLASILGVCKIYHNYYNILSLLFLNNIGITLLKGNLRITWFVSVLVSVSTFYFYILKHFEKRYTDLFIILITVFCYSFLIHFWNGYIAGNIFSVYYIFNTGVMRGLAGIGFGIVIANLYKMYKPAVLNYKSSLKSLLVYGIVECYIFCFIFNNLVLHRLSYKNDIIVILFFVLLFSLFILKRGFLSNLLNCKISEKLGKYAYSIFLMHPLVFQLLNFYVWKPHNFIVQNYPILQIVAAVTLSILCGVFTYHFIEKPAQIYLKKLFNNNSFSDNRGGGSF